MKVTYLSLLKANEDYLWNIEKTKTVNVYLHNLNVLILDAKI